MPMSAVAENLETQPGSAGSKNLPDFREIYDHHVDLVWRTLRRYGVPEASLADATQEVFVVVHSRLKTFEGRSSLRTWVFGIARRVARNHRVKNTDVSINEQQLNSIADLPSRCPEVAAEQLEIATWLELRLGELSSDKREAFVLVVMEQMTLGEASAVLRVPRNTIYSRLDAARHHLEQALIRQQAADQRRGT